MAKAYRIKTDIKSNADIQNTKAIEKSVRKVQRAKRSEKTESKASEKAPMLAPKKLQLLFTIVNREKAEFYVDLLQDFEVNMQMVLAGHGTADSKIQNLLGLNDAEKSVIISVIRKDRSRAALAELGEKFKTIKGGKGIAYTVPMSSTIGVAIYQFLSNQTNGGMI